MLERPKICTDRLLPRDMMRFNPVGLNADLRASAIAPIGKTWMNGSTLRIKFLGGTLEQHNQVMVQAYWLADHINLQLDFYPTGPFSDIRISFNPNHGAWSYIGTDCSQIPQDQPTLNLGFMDGGTPAHELMHAIGCGHEHQSPFGGIIWNEPVVLAECAKSPNFWSEETTRHNVLKKYSVNQINGTAFDPDSIMLYWFPKKWTLNGVDTRQNDVLSALDKSFIGSAKMYPKNRPTIVGAVELAVNGPSVEASIGSAGEEDLYFFHADTDGQYVIETDGGTDTVLRAYGPDSHTSLIAEDDDSGRGLRSLIRRGLVSGLYYAQVRHWNPRKGVGKYSIGVKKV